MSETIQTVLCGSPDRPLKIGEFEIQCYVLEDGTRVLSQRGMQKAIGMSTSGGSSGAYRLAKFASMFEVKGFVDKDLVARTQNPIKFRHSSGGRIAYGYEAKILPDLCEFILECRDRRLLVPQQQHYAVQCEVLVRGLARVGIEALVDEVTGHQEIRSRHALEEILDKFIAQELRKWAKTFPDDFYKELFRLRGWQFTPFSVKRPAVVGRLTNDLVYQRIAPGILEELRRKNPADDKGRRKHKHFQWLTEHVGHPRLREHLWAVIALMRASNNWTQFYRSLQRALPKYGDTMELPLPGKQEDGD